MSKEAMKLALEALEKCDSALSEERSAWDIDPPLHHVLDASNACGPAITALREALAEQPAQTDWEAVAADQAMTIAMMKAEQEPFCYHDGRNIVGHEFADHSDVFPLYTFPPPCPTCEALARTVLMDQTSHDVQRKPLTETEIRTLRCDLAGTLDVQYVTFARAIEAAHGIKENT